MAKANVYISSFERVEKKYMMTKEQFESFLQRTEDKITLDEYGLHTICNIYYDTDTYDLIRYSISKPKYKEKLRLRSYGIPSKESAVFVELKKKWNGVVFKRRTSMSLEEAKNYLDYGVRPDKESQIVREIDYFLEYYNPLPKLFLAYDRLAFFSNEDAQVRITVDQNIRSRTTDLDLSLGDYGEKLLEEGDYLMEIKVPGVFPLWLANILSELKIYPVSFSKYGNIYKKSLLARGV
ncbi:polyphosphate polymerase domain-containing protein [[Clostridium] polysaccharolyticum]|uniref:VTC domain-containing protein n=1 Tax=[Clostridium] polysaccharolyticum TaxID=29364 RepID=A0A1I0F620_9FIRM|nr:polyphosphate polymerase domain-containing protein [[Clostridium] polysaccharolyticum]SET53299.1 VTC domain-containing protein [[Clostridium] polysaccharolyticum]